MRGIAAGGQTALRHRGVGIFCSVVWKTLLVVDPDLPSAVLLVLVLLSAAVLLLLLLLLVSQKWDVLSCCACPHTIHSPVPPAFPVGGSSPLRGVPQPGGTATFSPCTAVAVGNESNLFLERRERRKREGESRIKTPNRHTQQTKNEKSKPHKKRQTPFFLRLIFISFFLTFFQTNERAAAVAFCR